MAIKRITKEELIEKATDIFYNYMSSSKEFYDYGDVVQCSDEYPTPMDMLWKETQDSIEENQRRITLFENEIRNNKCNEDCVAILEEQLGLLKEEREHFLKSNLDYQKGLYKKTKDLGYSRSIVRIPLDKLINSYYDDFILEVLFYDNIGVNNGVYDTYRALSCKEQRLSFIKKHTEITHMGLVVIRNGRHVCTVGLQGKIKKNNGGILILDYKFSDLKTLTLADTNEIDNNDVKQFFQSKIDLDKENLEVVADKDVRGDNYKILVDKADFYIRYICPSTGRVYFNKLNLNNLKLSEYFDIENYDSYIDSWWSINNLGASVEGEAILRC